MIGQGPFAEILGTQMRLTRFFNDHEHRKFYHSVPLYTYLRFLELYQSCGTREKRMNDQGMDKDKLK